MTDWRLTMIVVTAATMLVASTACKRQASEPYRGSRGEDRPWAAPILSIDEALAQNNVNAAEGAWHSAYLAALGSSRWESMMEIGDAALRIGEVAGVRKAMEPKARQAYLAALFRARNQRALDGLLRTAEAFAALGDHEVANQALRLAERLAAQARDTEAHHRVRALQKRLMTQVRSGGEF
jgi:hypothetical protein